MSSPEFAVQALYSSHHGWLNAWLRARLGNAADAADLANTVERGAVCRQGTQQVL